MLEKPIFVIIFMCLIFVLGSIEIAFDKKMRFSAFIVVILFSVLASLRSLEVPDTLGYMEFYNYIRADWSSLFVYYFEFGFTFLAALTKMIFGSNYHIFFFLVSLLNNLIILKAIDNFKFKNSVVPLLTYLSFYGFYNNFIFLRAGLALGFVILAFSIIDESKKKALILLILAIFFHISSFFGILVYIIFLNMRLLKKQSYLLWSLLISILYLIKVDKLILPAIFNLMTKVPFISNHRFAYYLESYNFQGGISLRFYSNIFLVLILLMFNIQKRGINYKYLNIYLTGLTIISLMSSFSWVDRITDFFIIFNFILVSQLVQILKDKGMKVLLLIIYIVPNLFFVFRILY